MDVCDACCEKGCEIKMTLFRGDYASYFASCGEGASVPNLVVVCFAGIGGLDGGEEVEMELKRVRETKVPWCMVAGTEVEIEVSC